MTTSISDAPSDLASHPVTPRGRFAWVLFEVGRNPSYVLISTFIYAPYFAGQIVGDPVRGQALWADIQIYAGLLVAVCAPFLAAIAEAGGPRKPWIAFFAALLALTCTLLWFGLPGGAGLSLAAIGLTIALNNFAYDSTIVFHGAMLSSLGPQGRIGRLSGLGYGLGNVATFTLLVFFLATIALPPQPLFGLDRATHEDARSVGPICALWFLIFALPFFLFTPDRRSTGLPMIAAMPHCWLSKTRVAMATAAGAANAVASPDMV